MRAVAITGPKWAVGIAVGAVGAATAATQSAGLSTVFLHERNVRLGAKSLVGPVIAVAVTTDIVTASSTTATASTTASTATRAEYGAPSLLANASIHDTCSRADRGFDIY